MTDKQLFQCLECGLHYETEETAKQCEAWCKKYDSCNLDIMKLSVERSKLSSKSGSSE
jgi:hypothetical protein